MRAPGAGVSRRRLLGRGAIAVGATGAVATLVGIGVGVWFLSSLDAALEDSVAVTATAVEALADTVDVAVAVADDTARTVQDAALAAAATEDATEATRAALADAADVAEQDVATSIAAVEDALPALADAAGVVDGTLRALDRLPLGPTYAPDVPLADAVRALRGELAGLPAALAEQAELLRDGAVELADVGRSTSVVAEDLDELAATLRTASSTLDELVATTGAAAATLGDGSDDLAAGLGATRLLLVLAGLGGTAAQLVVLVAGWWLLDPARVARLLDGPGDHDVTPPAVDVPPGG